MKFLLITILAIAAANAEINYDGPEWQLDFSTMVPITETPGFWDDKTAFHKFLTPVNVRDRNTRIVGGQPANPHAHPYQLVLALGLTGLCGATIVNPRTVLSAAHCRTNAASSTIIAGAHNRAAVEASQQRITITNANFRFHPQYNPNNLNNDIMTIQLTSGALTWTPQIQPSVLPRDYVGQTFAGWRGVSSGWGRTADNQAAAQILHYVENTIITNAVCAQTYGTGVVNANVICIETEGGRGTCQGDSGGPLTVYSNGRRVQVGVTSFGAAAGCERGFPAGFERITGHLAFIDANTMH